MKFSINDLLNSIYKWQEDGELDDKEQGAYAGIEEAENKVKRNFKVSFPPDTHYILTQKGKTSVLEVEIIVQTYVEREEIQLSEVYEYSDLNERISQIAVGNISINDNPEDDLKIYVQ